MAAGSDAEVRLAVTAHNVYLVLSGHSSFAVRVNGALLRKVEVRGIPRLYPLLSGHSYEQPRSSCRQRRASRPTTSRSAGRRYLRDSNRARISGETCPGRITVRRRTWKSPPAGRATCFTSRFPRQRDSPDCSPFPARLGPARGDCTSLRPARSRVPPFRPDTLISRPRAGVTAFVARGGSLSSCWFCPLATSIGPHEDPTRRSPGHPPAP